MCYQHKELLQIDPVAISSTCLMSLQQPSGILLLEEGLLQAGGQDEPPAKRSRVRKEIPPDTKKWIHLARSYCSHLFYVAGCKGLHNIQQLQELIYLFDQLVYFIFGISKVWY